MSQSEEFGTGGDRTMGATSLIGDAPCVDDVWRCPRMRDRALSGRERRDVDMHWRESDRVSVRDNVMCSMFPILLAPFANEK